MKSPSNKEKATVNSQQLPPVAYGEAFPVGDSDAEKASGTQRAMYTECMAYSYAYMMRRS